MRGDAARSCRYRLVVCGELGDRFGIAFEGMKIERSKGMTILTGTVVDQAHLHGLIDRTQELGIELVSVEQVDDAMGNS
jgi:hypothetical protein